jgi:hypothetical protein
MTNDEARRNDEIQMSKKLCLSFRHLSIRASFVIRHSCFVISVASGLRPNGASALRYGRAEQGRGYNGYAFI